eukprot:TRINITY_DN4416_c0_g1_i1.p1 TRINITY_DN4416_c0_g1~~TRINITY_DN4416_c0_g1_i1.p1  ORF type:complete len:395 (-),score=138.85 TRINITY_DN4416_c0_g1_i1:113-1297(-)
MSYISNVYDVLGDGTPDSLPIKAKKDKTAPKPNVNAPAQQPASSPKVEQKAPEKKADASKGASPKVEAKKDDKKPAEKKANNGAQKPAENKEVKSKPAASPKEGVSSPIEGAGDSPVFSESRSGDNRSGFRNEKREARDKGFSREKDFNGRGRAMDRKSGTGRSPTENKRGGAGKANWGGVEEEIKDSIAEVENTEAANGEGEKKETKSETPATTTPATTEKPVEEEDKSITYEEYLRKLKQQTVRGSSVETRKAGEGVDDKQWADYQPLHKQDPEQKPKKKESKEKEKEKDEKVKKVAVEEVFSVKYASSQPERRERRGGDRERRGGGGGGRGGPREGGRDNRDNRDNRFRQGNTRKENAPNVTDQHVFPSLKSPTLTPTSSPSTPAPAPVKA